MKRYAHYLKIKVIKVEDYAAGLEALLEKSSIKENYSELIKQSQTSCEGRKNNSYKNQNKLED